MGFYLTLRMIFLYKYYDLQYFTQQGGCNILLPERFTGTTPLPMRGGPYPAPSMSQCHNTEDGCIIALLLVELALDPERKGLMTNES